MRRTHLCKHDNILKRQLIHVGAFNLSLIFRRLRGQTPRGGGSFPGCAPRRLTRLLQPQSSRHGYLNPKIVASLS
jgi:hypothetical protein